MPPRHLRRATPPAAPGRPGPWPGPAGAPTGLRARGARAPTAHLGRRPLAGQRDPLRSWPQAYSALRGPWLPKGALALALLLGCQPRTAPPAGAVPTALAPARDVPAAHAGTYRALEDARRQDPGGVAVERAARALLGEGPPPDLAARAHLALAERAWLDRRDLEAAREATRGLEIAPTGPVAEALARVKARAQARGGDPDEALARLGSLNLPPEEDAALRALALDRAGRAAEAVEAFLRWRLSTRDPASAAFALARARELAGALDPQELLARAKGREATLAACLELLAGRHLPAAPPEAAPCARSDRGRQVGVLLPRTGPYRALADEELAAVAASVEVLPGLGPVFWADGGGDPAAVRAALTRLAARGADVVVGPVARPDVVAQVARDAPVPLWLPGPPPPGEDLAGRLRAVAPPLAARVRALAGAAAEGPVLLLVPAAPYGREVAREAGLILEESGGKRLIVQEYQPSMSDLLRVARPALERLSAGGTLWLADTVGRTDRALRQIARVAPDTLARVRILVTAEGLAPIRIPPSLEGAWVAPVAVAGPDDAAFVEAYARREQGPPTPHALLVYRALRAAAEGGGEARPPAAVLRRVRDGRLAPP